MSETVAAARQAVAEWEQKTWVAEEEFEYAKRRLNMASDTVTGALVNLARARLALKGALALQATQPTPEQGSRM